MAKKIPTFQVHTNCSHLSLKSKAQPNPCNTTWTALSQQIRTNQWQLRWNVSNLGHVTRYRKKIELWVAVLLELKQKQDNKSNCLLFDKLSRCLSFLSAEKNIYFRSFIRCDLFLLHCFHILSPVTRMQMQSIKKHSYSQRKVTLIRLQVRSTAKIQDSTFTEDVLNSEQKCLMNYRYIIFIHQRTLQLDCEA